MPSWLEHTMIRDLSQHPNQHAGLAPNAVLLPIFAGLACVLSIPPLLTNLASRNISATILVLGTSILNLQNFINALIWPDADLVNRFDGSVLCDVEVKLQIGIVMAIAGAMTSLFCQFARILDIERSTLIPTKGQKRKRLTFELFLTVLLPSYLMAVHYIVQPERYWILPISGCAPSFDNSWPSYVLIFIWPILISAIGAGYCAIATVRLIKYRRQMTVLLSSSSNTSTSSMTKTQFFRLFFLAFTLLFIYFPLAVFTFVRNLSNERHAYSWSEVHPDNWSQLIRLDASQSLIPFDRWIQIGTGYFLFLFFGIGHDARAMYRSWWTSTKRILTRTLVVLRIKQPPPQISQDTRARPMQGHSLGDAGQLLDSPTFDQPITGLQLCQSPSSSTVAAEVIKIHLDCQK